MHKNVKITLSLTIVMALSAFTLRMDKIGHIFKIDVEVAETLSRRQIAYYNGAMPVYKGEADLETFSEEKVNEIVQNFAKIISVNSNSSTVTFEGAKISASNKFGNLASNALAKSKMPYFPKAKLKKLKVDAQAYYEIEIDLMYGGGKARTIVMNKINKLSTIKFNAKIQVTAFTKGGDELWKKEKTIIDFSEVFNSADLPYQSGDKWFELTRVPVQLGELEKIGEAPFQNVQNDDFWPLTLNEIESCMVFALTKTLE